jgi:hypothetical protein
MKRLVTRYHPENETHFTTEQAAKQFDDLLMSEGYKLLALGLFRNKFIMEHQDLILDKKLTPFDKARKIIIAAYEAAGILVPCWLMRKQLEQNQLEESIADNKVIIKRAFETYIDVNFRNALNYWHRDDPKQDGLELPTQISDRLAKLVDSNLLPDIKRSQRTNELCITRGVLAELYKYGLAPEQLPNLPALHHCIEGSRYKIRSGHWVIYCNASQLERYFDGAQSEETG